MSENIVFKSKLVSILYYEWHDSQIRIWNLKTTWKKVSEMLSFARSTYLKDWKLSIWWARLKILLFEPQSIWQTVFWLSLLYKKECSAWDETFDSLGALEKHFIKHTFLWLIINEFLIIFSAFLWLSNATNVWELCWHIWIHGCSI